MTGMMYSGLSCFVLQGMEPWTFRNLTPDADRTRPAKNFVEIKYPKPDGVLSFDLLTNLQRSGTFHDSDQPAHLRVKENKKTVPSSKQDVVYVFKYMVFDLLFQLHSYLMIISTSSLFDDYLILHVII